jgi:hypothetical protein
MERENQHQDLVVVQHQVAVAVAVAVILHPLVLLLGLLAVCLVVDLDGLLVVDVLPQ